MKLNEYDWFEESQAQRTQDLVRMLVRLYAEACESVSRLPYELKRVHLGGVWTGKPLWVVKAFFQDAVIRHIQTNLRSLQVVSFQALLANIPTPSELALGVKKTAPAEVVKRAEQEREQFEHKRKLISTSLDAAASDIKAMGDLVKEYKSLSTATVFFVGKLISRISLAGLLTWVIARFSSLSRLPLMQGVALALVWIAIYHILGLLAAPFHDSSYRKYQFFEGYIGSPDDRLKPIFPPVSRIEKEFYEQLKITMPVVISWDDLIPPVHYVGMIFIVLVCLYFLPLTRGVRNWASVLALVIVATQLRRLGWWWSHLQQRYEGKSLAKLIAATILPN